MVLDIGCGSGKAEGAIGIDIYQYEGVDVVHNIDVTPWPFEDNTFETINAKHIIEHVGSIPSFMKEIHRIGKPGATLIIDTPHFSSRDSWADPTHRWHLSIDFADLFTQGHYLAAQTGEYKILKKKVSFGSFLVSWPQRLICTLFGYYTWERYFCFIFRGRNLHIEMSVDKE